MIRSLTLAFVISSFVGHLNAQRTWILDQLGSGHFRTLAQAASSLKDGDRILLKPGAYEWTDLAKSLVIHGEANAFLWTSTSRIRVRNLPKGKTLVFDSVTFAGRYAANVYVENCQGRVAIRNSKVTSTLGDASIVVQSCPAVSIENTQVTGHAWVSDSTVCITQSRFIGRQINHFSLPPAGLTAVRSIVDITNCDVTGAAERFYPRPSAPALDSEDSRIVVRGVQSSLRSGASSIPPLVGLRSTLTLDPRIVSKATGFTLVSRRLPVLTSSHDTPIGSTLTIEVSARSGELFDLWLSVPSIRRAGPFGGFWLDPTLLLPLAIGFVPPSEFARITIPIPKDPKLQWLTLALQGSAGTWPNLAYSNATTVFIRP